MNTEIQSYITYFEQAHADLGSLIASLSQEALHWTPLKNGTNSPAILVTHMLGAERFRIHQVVAGFEVARNRDTEFQTTTVTLTDILSSLERLNDETKRVLSNITSADLNIIKPAARDYENEESARWHIIHTVEHFGIHLGHLSLTIQMYNEHHQSRTS